MYKRGFDRIMATNKSLELFKPVSISFCDYSDGCKNLISPDNSSVISSGDIDYLITALSNRLNHPLAYLSESEYREVFLKTFSSVRKYSSSSFHLTVVNVQIGQIYGDEPMPQISLGDNIESAVYEEPILYHGFGRDLFFVKE